MGVFVISLLWFNDHGAHAKSDVLDVYLNQSNWTAGNGNPPREKFDSTLEAFRTSLAECWRTNAEQQAPVSRQ